MPVEQYRSAYPPLRGQEDEPTFVASPAAWSVAVDEWPVLGLSPAGEETAVAHPGEPRPEFPPAIAGPPVVPAPVWGPEVDDEVEEEIEEEPVAVGLPVAAAAAGAAAEPVVVEPHLPEPPLELPDVPAAVGVARHRIDPLDAAGRRRFWRRSAAELTAAIEVPARPPADRALPHSSRGQSRPAGR